MCIRDRDSTTVSSLIAEDRTLLIAQAPYVFVPNTYKEWACVTPLTSEWNDTKQWLPSCLLYTSRCV